MRNDVLVSLLRRQQCQHWYQPGSWWRLYFSFITLTSVGFGDLTPVSAIARSLAMFAGLFGQLYMAILIAKLVGVYTAQKMEKTRS